MIYIINKYSWEIIGNFANMSYVEQFLSDHAYDKNNLLFLTEQNDMIRYISRIVYMQKKDETEKTCIYNDKEFWTSNLSEILNNFEDYKFFDILGQEISKERFMTEMNTNIDRIIAIDGRPGQIMYDMTVGKEFVSLFREECILTKFTKESNTSPMKIFEKLATVIAMLDAGAFREAKQYLQGYRELLKDDFLTDERIDKYIAMLDAADAIEYATEEDYFYTVPGEDQ